LQGDGSDKPITTLADSLDEPGMLSAVIERFANLLNADPQSGIDDFGSRPQCRHHFIFCYQTMGIPNKKIEYCEGLRSEKNLLRAAQEGSVRRVEDEGIKYEPRPVAHLPPLWGRLGGPAPTFTEILRSHYCHKWPVRVNDRGAMRLKARFTSEDVQTTNFPMWPGWLGTYSASFSRSSLNSPLLS
jgi:hypothetical protein